jgi:Fe-S-cluster containining protein
MKQTKPALQTDPCVLPEPPQATSAALKLEKEAITILKSLVKKQHSSCTSSAFRVGYERVLDLFGRFQKEVLDSYPLPVTCGAKCGACCHHWPEDTYSFEVEFIAEFLKKNVPRKIPGICKTLRADCDLLEKTRAIVAKKYSTKAMQKKLGDIDPYDLVLSSFYEQDRPCPLLTKDGSCSIHPIRPLTCRVYVSFSPKKYCEPAQIGSEAALTCLLDFEQDASDLFDQLHFMYDMFDGDTSFRSMLLAALQR